MSFGEKLRELRKSKKMSQAELSQHIGVHEKHVTKMEHNKGVPSTDSLMKIAKLFEVSIDYLLFNDVPQNTDLTTFSDAELADLIFKADTLSAEDKEIAKGVIKALITKTRVDNLLK